MISVIIPVYNTEKYIVQCIQSIISQTFQDWELILIDDGSTDTSGDICDRFSSIDNRIFVIHTKNKGAGHARNTGLDNSHGDIVVFVDADDYIADNSLTLYNKHGEFDIVWQGIEEFHENGTKEQYSYESHECYSFSELNELYVELWKRHIFGYTVVKSFKRSILEKNHIRFCENISVKEDEIFTMCYLQYANSAISIKNIAYHYRILNNSVSHTRWEPLRLFKTLTIEENVIYKNKFSSEFTQLIYNTLIDQYQYILRCIYFPGNIYPTSDRKKIINYIYNNNRISNLITYTPYLYDKYKVCESKLIMLKGKIRKLVKFYGRF